MTGELIPVGPGEGIFTNFQLLPVPSTTTTTSSSSSLSFEWHIFMGVIGDPTRVSKIIVDRPFMGLVPNTTSWSEDIYEEVYVESCLEDYYMNNSKSYPSFWKMGMYCPNARRCITPTNVGRLEECTGRRLIVSLATTFICDLEKLQRSSKCIMGNLA